MVPQRGIELLAYSLPMKDKKNNPFNFVPQCGNRVENV